MAASVDATAAFISLEKRVGEVKDDLGKRIDTLTTAIDRLADGVVRKDVLEEALARRDERIERVEKRAEATELELERQDERGKNLRNALIITVVTAVLGIAAALVLRLV